MIDLKHFGGGRGLWESSSSDIWRLPLCIASRFAASPDFVKHLLKGTNGYPEWINPVTFSSFAEERCLSYEQGWWPSTCWSDRSFSATLSKPLLKNGCILGFSSPECHKFRSAACGHDLLNLVMLDYLDCLAGLFSRWPAHLFANSISFTTAIAQSTSQCNGVHAVVAEEMLYFTNFNKRLKDLGV